MASIHPMEQVLKYFESKMGKLYTEIHNDMYSDRLDVRIKCNVTNDCHTFAINSRLDEEELVKQTRWHLDRIEDKIYTARGKHLTKSYDFYSDPKGAVPWATGGPVRTPVGKSSVSGKMMYDERTIEDIQRAADEEVKKRKIIEAAKMAEAEAKRKEEEAKRKEAYDGNTSFGTF